MAMAIALLASTALDCSDPAALASFWAELVGGEVAFTSPEFCAVKTDNGWLATVRIDDYKPPTWPDSAVPKQMHLKPSEQPAPDRWRVLLDPAGHPFCLSNQIPQ